MIPIFLISDEKYAKYAAVTIQSVISGTREKLAFYVLDGGISEDTAKKMFQMVEKSKNSIEFIKIDIKLFEKFPNLAHFSLNSYFRYLIADLKPEIKKALYIDADMLICGDVAEIYKTDMKGRGIAAVPYIQEELRLASFLKHKKNLGLQKDHLYFNSGLMLMDCEYWRKNNISKLLFDKTAELCGKLQMPDQDVLNVVFENNYAILPKQFNLVMDLSIEYIHLDKLLKNNSGCFVLHYTGGKELRPWMKKDVPCAQNFWDIAKDTPFYFDLKDELLLNEMAEINRKQNYIKEFLLFISNKLSFNLSLSLALCSSSIYLIILIPILKIKVKNNITRYYFLGFIPFLKTEDN